MNQPAYEVNFDGLVGPTHHYAGLSHGNLASKKHEHHASNPKQAALQGLAKMKRLADLGLKQAVLPPHDRPDLQTLRQLGFQGDDSAILAQAHRESPGLLAAASSASSMWAANAATVSPSPDTADQRVHFTPANLVSHLHRSLEPPTTAATLRAIFKDDHVFAHHPPLPPSPHLGDEGAANHTRLCRSHHEHGLELFVYGKAALDTKQRTPTQFPARQTREAAAAIARRHRLDSNRVIFIQQNPAAIDAGVFHNDVIAVGNRNVLLVHTDAYVDTPRTLDQLRQTYRNTCNDDLVCIEVTPDALPLADAVSTYLFNSQLVDLPDGNMALICPIGCTQHQRTQRVLDQIIADDNPIAAVHPVDVRQSMQNGGGPACLRLRVVLTEPQRQATHPGVFLTDTLYDQLTAWVNRHYRDRLQPHDLADPQLLDESRTALDQLTQILNLVSLYPFQRHTTA